MGQQSESAALLSWLDAAITVREEAAQACSGAPWSVDISPMLHVDARAVSDNKQRWGKLGYVATVERDADRSHIVLNDPAAVLRRCAADRKLLALHNVPGNVFPDSGYMDDNRWCVGCGHDSDGEPRTLDVNDCPTLHALAEGYGRTVYGR